MTTDLLPPRIAVKVVIDKNGCWEWTGNVNHNGYATTSHLGTVWRLHRLTYTLAKGDIADGMDLDHLCRNRACCNPDHLEPVTRSQNMWRSPFSGLKTHCHNGHEYTPESTRFERDGHRRCRTCVAARRRRYTASLTT